MEERRPPSAGLFAAAFPAGAAGRFRAALLCLGAALFFFPPRLDGPINVQDDGIWLAVAQAAAEGKTLYRDIAYHFGPLLYAPLRALFAVRPATLSGARTVFWAENLLGLWIVLLLLWKWVRQPSVRLPFFVFLGIVPFAAHTLSIPYAARYGAGFLPMLFWPASSDDKGHPFLSGLLVGAAYGVSQEVGVAALMAGASFFWRRDGFGRGARLHAAGVAAALAAGFLVLGLTADLRFYGSSSVTDIGRLVFLLRQPFPGFDPALWARAWRGDLPWIVPWMKTTEAAAGRFPVLLCLATLWPRFRRRLGDGEGRGAALAVYGLVAAVSAWARSDRWHIYFALSPALLLLALWADKVWKGSSRRGGVFFLGVLSVGSFLTFPPFIGSRARDAVLEPVLRSVDLPRAGRTRLPSTQAEGYEFLAAEIDRRVPPGSPFFFYPFNGAAYFMADRPNPCRWPLPVDAQRPDQQDAMIRQLEDARVRWVVWDRQEDVFDGVPIAQLLSRLQGYLEKNFVPRDQAGPFLFLERKQPS